MSSVYAGLIHYVCDSLMKVYKIVLYIIGVLLSLWLLSYLFPSQGLKLGYDTTLRFPSLHEVLAEEEPLESEEEVDSVIEILSPEELLALREAEQQAALDSEFVAFCKKSATRIHMPDEDVTYLDPLFEALENAKERPLRIMHYGDSQLEGDRITGVFREKIQETFGGNGTGLLPAVQTIGMATARVETFPELPHFMNFGSSEFHADHKRYGPLAQVAQIDSFATFAITALGGSVYPHCRSFRRVSLAMRGDGEITVEAGGEIYSMTCPLDTTFQGLRLFSTLLPRSVYKATITATGQMEVYALMIDGANGVSVDNIAMRGVSGTFFTSLERNSLAPFFTQQNVRLILLQYGGNSMPYLKPGKSISNYKRQLMRQINLFKKMSPESRIIFIGPSDMATNVENEMKTYPHLPMVVDSIRQAALESGVAFWDMYRAMGGRGSMAKWVNSDPPLAGEDYIHFTPRGSRRMGEIFHGAFDFYYRYYRHRHGLDKEEKTDSIVPADSIAPKIEQKNPNSIPNNKQK